jgi:succinyl-CoA synthetase beta subunit
MNTKPKNCSARTALPFPTAAVAFTVEEAKAAAEKLGAYPVVVKAQIHAGGRGLGGGVKVARTAEEFDEFANSILGMNLVTKQTGPGGKQVKKLLVEQGLNIAKELYLSILPDRATAKMIIMASEAGGMDIEDVAEKTPGEDHQGVRGSQCGHPGLPSAGGGVRTQHAQGEHETFYRAVEKPLQPGR